MSGNYDPDFVVVVVLFLTGSDTIVEVLITAFQRICSNLGSKEFMWENLYREIIDSVDNRCLFHLGCLLSLLIATVEIDNDQGVSGKLKTKFDILISILSCSLLLYGYNTHMCNSSAFNGNCFLCEQIINQCLNSWMFLNVCLSRLPRMLRM